MQRTENRREWEDKLKTWNTIGTKPTNGKPKNKLWNGPECTYTHTTRESRVRKTKGNKKNITLYTREKETQAINLSNIQFHSNYDSTVRKLKRFIRVEKVFGGNFSEQSLFFFFSCTHAHIHVRCNSSRWLHHCLYRFSFWEWLFMSRDLSSVLTFSLVAFIFFSLSLTLFFSVFYFVAFFVLSRLLFIIFICYPRLFTCVIHLWVPANILPRYFSMYTFFLFLSISIYIFSFSLDKHLFHSAFELRFPKVSISFYRQIKTHGKMFNFISLVSLSLCFFFLSLLPPSTVSLSELVKWSN